MQPILSSEQLEEAILEYNLKYRGKWRFHLLHSFFNQVNYIFTITVFVIFELYFVNK